MSIKPPDFDELGAMFAMTEVLHRYSTGIDAGGTDEQTPPGRVAGELR